MKNDEKSEEKCCPEKMIFKRHHHHHRDSGNVIYGLGVVGALFYFLQSAKTFGTVVIGIGKAIFWPAILIFKLLTYLKV